MHNLGVIVHQKAYFSLKYLLILKKMCSFALEFLIRNRIYKHFKGYNYVRN